MKLGYLDWMLLLVIFLLGIFTVMFVVLALIFPVLEPVRDQFVLIASGILILISMVKLFLI